MHERDDKLSILDTEMRVTPEKEKDDRFIIPLFPSLTPTVPPLSLGVILVERERSEQ